MKRILLAGATLLALTAAQPTLAADAPVYRKAPPPAEALFNWSGFYIGGDLGYLWGTASLILPAVPAAGPEPKPAGISFGPHVGFRYQFAGGLVIGIEGDYSWLNAKGPASAFPTAPAVGALANLDWSASLRGILGFAMNRSLIYATGGGAWVHGNGCGVATAIPTTCIANLTFSGTWSGWTAGAGIAFAVTNNLIARIEYLYADYGAQTFVTPGFTGGLANVRVTTNVVRGGLSWKW